MLFEGGTQGAKSYRGKGRESIQTLSREWKGRKKNKENRDLRFPAVLPFLSHSADRGKIYVCKLRGGKESLEFGFRRVDQEKITVTDLMCLTRGVTVLQRFSAVCCVLFVAYLN